MLNVTQQVREEAEEKACKEEKQKAWEEVERIVREAERVMHWAKHQEEKLNALLTGMITMEEFQEDSRAEVEKSKVMGEGVQKILWRLRLRRWTWMMRKKMRWW